MRLIGVIGAARQVVLAVFITLARPVCLARVAALAVQVGLTLFAIAVWFLNPAGVTRLV